MYNIVYLYITYYILLLLSFSYNLLFIVSFTLFCSVNRLLRRNNDCFPIVSLKKSKNFSQKHFVVSF